ncbi:MAG: T9SS type A sorting domain-containing protein [Chryseobacterium sp.]|jgi:hypothetical protein|uniref:T9SS type A sorting domain-containing protein n=1 Tax=Chryseobacterium sp. TaxID=1871047 RepID=UPI0028181A4E|nr:T9SS type A sorting domain-containing protein [Chryseobacterium sp.]MDR2236551.1 T9SS type A sorting domain-containing protein [Chryseobacterium sp.]
MKKIFLTLSVGVFSVTYAQNLNFYDSKFKALLLSSTASNSIVKDLSGNSIAIDTNGDGEIQLSEAQQVKILNLNLDPSQTLIDPNGDPYDSSNINVAYYNSHLPDGISDALLFPNLEELYFRDTKTASISFTNNAKIRKVQGRPFYYDFSQGGLYSPSAVNLSFDNCSAITDIADIIAFPSNSSPWRAPENTLTIRNCQQINGDIVINSADLEELYIQDSNINTLTFNSCRYLKKIAVPNLSSLTKISVLGGPSGSPLYMQNIELIANNCVNLQEIKADTDHYNSTGAYFSSVNLNGCTSLKKIMGLNAPVIDFSTAGLVNLEELDCSFYNRYIYHTTSGVYFGDVTSLNLTGLPKLKVLKAFNQKITNQVNFSTAQALENIDISNSCGYMNTVNVSNLSQLHTLATSRTNPNDNQGNTDLEHIIAKNCVALTSLVFSSNVNLKSLDVENCISLDKMIIDSHPYMTNISSLEDINLKQCTGLTEVSISDNKVSSLNIQGCTALKSLELTNLSLLPALSMTDNTQLETLGLFSLPLLAQANTSANPYLKTVNVVNCPQITQLNFSASSHMEVLGLTNMRNLTYVNLRNGAIEDVLLDYEGYTPNLSMCVDDAQLSDLQTMYPEVNFTTNCGGGVLANKESEQTAHSVKIYPNPTKDRIQIRYDSPIKNVTIINPQGMVMFNRNYNTELVNIDLSDYQSAVYLIRITTDKGQFSEKVIKN